MLELHDITKDYKVADEKVHALKGISLSFRESEFVSILGPSGCGKTTMLNIIGGLDHYTSGDLVINGVSTKNYHDRDWDTYRNHKIGFVFQSYNLIPHQTISENVELALNISGVPRQERIRRAHEALDKVGLKGLYNKKPNQLSGGQCQRVAIARALVNDPEILLADEPTGALDTVTSKQIMDLIKEISSDCLVIMVTHNPELAEQYSTRIIRLLDGLVTDDSNPFTPGEQSAETEKPVLDAAEEKPSSEESLSETPKTEKTKKSKLSVWNAFRLSAKNLLSKIKRTILVCFAGSIGIVGVATVLAVSAGVTGYIENMQNDMLSGNPITISEETLDFTALMESMMGSAAAGPAIKDSVEKGKVNIDKLIETLVKSSGAMDTLRVKNNITKDYVKYVLEMPEEFYKSISVNYGLDLSGNLYTDFTFTEADENGGEGATKQVVKNMSLQSATQTYLGMLAHTEQAAFTSYFTMVNNSFRQSPGGEDFILSQYDIISDPENSKVATEADEIMIVVSRDTALTDLMLAQYGFYSQDEFLNHCYGAMGLDTYDPELDKSKLDYSELLGKTYTWYPNDVIYTKRDDAFLPINQSFDYSPYSSEEWQGGKTLHVSAILRPKEDLSYGSLSTGFYYTSALSEEILAANLESEIVKYLQRWEMDSFTSAVSVQGMTIDNIPRYEITYYLNGDEFTETFYIGTPSGTGAMLSMMGIEIDDTYMLSMRELGGKDIPSSISIYPTNFTYKDNVTDYIARWNDAGDLTVGGVIVAKDDRPEITYADNLGLAISLINDMIEMVTAALVAFTSLSLVVSTVMIAIITYVSVIERVKEIGVIRSLGGRKRDVSALFIAETFMIGGISGIFGIGITYVIQLILNIIIGTLFGVPNIAALPIWQAFVMIGVSIVLTLISGLIPARLAAQKDPVDALRTE
ncbi:MAG: ABC transporter ATP-binding protein/permease [Clostridiales bacterium]|nr:ABC transporter ATP-binding protein/permease [Clostridiales bacterium]